MLAAALLRQFELSSLELRQIAAAFHDQLKTGRTDGASSLKMLPAYLSPPTGREQGTFLALDFGGTNLRFSLVELHGNGCWTIAHQFSFPLRCSEYDLTTAKTSASELFATAAQQLAACPWLPRQPLALGHTFSYPVRQTGPNTATLIRWTKELAVSSFTDQDINTLVAHALQQNGLGHIRPMAIVNDTIATLLTAVYANPASDLAAICGTGHNMACLDPLATQPAALLVNLESGGFDGLRTTPWDERLAAATLDPHEQRLEKMVAGHYLGELSRLLLNDLLALPPSAIAPYSLTTQTLSFWLTSAGEASLQAWLLSHALPHGNAHTVAAVKALAAAVLRRAGQLVAATAVGAQRAIDPDGMRRHVLSIDGSLYFGCPVFAAALTETAQTLDPDRPLAVAGLRDGSSSGAAIAAALVSKK